ncbi:hypothetical protein pb186bvf_004750 [Paramecium bursaria]
MFNSINNKGDFSFDLILKSLQLIFIQNDHKCLKQTHFSL